MQLGKAFSDNVQSGYGRPRWDKENTSWWLGKGRALLFATLLILSFSVLLLRLFHLTVVQGHYYRTLADNNRIRELIIHAPRGRLMDRTGKVLTENVKQYRVMGPCEGKDKPCLGRVSEEEAREMIRKGLPRGTYLEEDWVRRYPYGYSTAHVVGYTGEITESELNDEYYSLRKYIPGDRIGRVGAEAVYEEKLRGRDGRELVEVDSAGAVVRTLGKDREVPGTDVQLSLDAGLSETVRTAYPSDSIGAVIVAKPETGEILAMYSSPSYSPNAFSQGLLSPGEYEAVTLNPDLPLFNRAIGGVYPPGSTFKIVTSIAGLESGAINAQTNVEDIGVITIGTQFRFPNWYFLKYGKTDGIVNIVKALQRSNDIFFYKAGEWIGITNLSTWAKKVGLGKPLGIELAGEASGLMPDPAWKQSHFTSAEDIAARNNDWYVGDTYHVAIGQGYLLTTPLQVNTWTNVIAHGGKVCRPTIEKISQSKNKQSRCTDIGIQKETIDLVTEGMLRACATGGTGWPLFNFSVIPANAGIQSPNDPTGPPVVAGDDKVRIPVACKTGTAEFGDPKDRTHAWFTAFAPVRAEAVSKIGTSDSLNSEEVRAQGRALSGEPELSVTVLVEGAGEGSDIAAPVAKKVFEEWFGR